VETFASEAGQFYMLQTGSTYDPLLKRPFSVFEEKGGCLSFLYRVRGKGTSCLSSLSKGNIIQAIGPLGNGYPLPDGDFIAVVGGVGMASLFPLLKRFKKKAYVFYGARTKDELMFTDKIKAFSKKLFIATDDGSSGKKGLITDNLYDFLNVSRITHHALRIYACGPFAMLKKTATIALQYNMKCFVSLEEHMACGIGACLGCVAKVNDIKYNDWHYERVCKEGPVFDAENIQWSVPE
jgi:dihydroorotate dehydrogenase electron transfer subunit